MTTQGARANIHGSVLENLVFSTLEPHGFELVRYPAYKKKPDGFGEELLIKNVPYTTVYGGRGYTEFLLISKKHDLTIRIECKWQQGPGSVDEKLPYTYLSCVEAAPEDDVIILIDGPGFRPGSVEWLRRIVTERKYITEEQANKNIKVMNMGEFVAWANGAFR